MSSNNGETKRLNINGWLENPGFDIETRPGMLVPRSQNSLELVSDPELCQHIARLQQAFGGQGIPPERKTLAREYEHGFPHSEIRARGSSIRFDTTNVQIVARMIYGIVLGQQIPYIAQAAAVSWNTLFHVKIDLIGTRENNAIRFAYAEIEFAAQRPYVEVRPSPTSFSRDPDIRFLKHDGHTVTVPQAAGIPRMRAQDGILKYR